MLKEKTSRELASFPQFAFVRADIAARTPIAIMKIASTVQRDGDGQSVRDGTGSSAGTLEPVVGVGPDQVMMSFDDDSVQAAYPKRLETIDG